MRTTPDEQRALAFIAALLLVSAAVRLAALPEPMEPPSTAGFDLDGHIAATERAVAEEERRSRPLAKGERLDPNTASADELDRLPGVGPAVAGRIVAARAEGPFRSVEEMMRVPGVGKATVERLAPHLTLPRAGTGADGARRGVATGTVATRMASGTDRGADGGDVLDLNRASAEALTSLTGVGPVLAARIVAYRDSVGPFTAVDSLVAVTGIGPATLERIRPRLRVQ